MRTLPPSHHPHIDVWSEFDLPNYDTLLDKANLVTLIETAIRHRQLSIATAAAQPGTDEPALCALLHSEFHAYPTESLPSFLANLAADDPFPPEKSRAGES